MNTLIDIAHEFARRGGQPAIIYRTGVRRVVISYGTLDVLVRRMVTLLSACGVGEGDRVIVWGSNSPWWVVAYWGIVCRGAVVVPVDAASGSDRVHTVMALTEPSLIIRGSSRELAPCGIQQLLLEDLESMLSPHPPVAELFPAVASRLAQLVYTSGTTGNPKGVMLSHGNLAANVRQIRQHLPIVTPDFHFLSLLPLSHLFEQTTGMLTPLSAGAAVVYLRVVKPAAIMEALAEEDIQVVIAVPRLLLMLRNGIKERMARAGLEGTFNRLLSISDRLPRWLCRLLFWPIRRRFGKGFRLFVSGGAPLSVELFRFWSRIGSTVIEGYGLTECSPVLAANTLEFQSAGSVGTPLPGVELCIRDGELLARGDNVFGGYYGNPAATAQVLTEDGWFRTGDLAEWGEDGRLRIKGRCREMIVTGAGVNVYPDEIEELLLQQAGVRDACVLGLDRGSGDEVHAVLLLHPGANAAGIVAAANARLDDLHRITSHSIWFGEDFPRTTTLKIRKFMVREALQSGHGDAGTSPADRLLAIIARITGVSAESLSDCTLLVADAGLTSIGRLELVTALEEEFRLDLDESAIGPATSIGDVREMIRQRGRAGTSLPYRLWTDSRFMGGVRRIWNAVMVAPLLALCARVTVEGAGHLEGISGPVIFIANHQSYLDQPCIQQALPQPFAWRTATAAWGEFFFPPEHSTSTRLWKRLCFEYCSLAVNIVLLPQHGGFRNALRHMGRLADRGTSILVFPEGERSRDGQLLPFRPGLAMMVEELGVPVVPIAIVGVERILPRGGRFPRPGRVVVRFGPLLRLEGKGRDEIMALSRWAVERLLAGADPG